MRWSPPPPPSPDELRRLTPTVRAVPAGIARPRWSVMIPTHDSAEYLRGTLASVLAQDPGPEAMQIEVVDDASTTDDPAAVATAIGHSRVGFYRNPANLGATRTFNVCIERARGEWVHILHGDDQVMPGFYTECEAITAAAPDVVMIIGQVVTMDEAGHWLDVIGPPDWAGRAVPEFLRRQAVEQTAQFAGVVVRRSAYERAGGFCTAFDHVADRDMWFRVAHLGPVWCTTRPYGLYRIHAAADTGRHMVRGTNVLETWLSTQINLARLDNGHAPPDAAAFRRWLAHRAYRNARKLYARGILDGSLNQVVWSLRLRPSARAFGLWARARLLQALHLSRRS